MVKVTIRGKEFPLCLTVAALDKINVKCGGLNELTAWLKGNGSTSEAICNTAWLLGVMIEEGEENRLIEARFEKDIEVERRGVPDAEAISHLLTPGSAKRYMVDVWKAVDESLAQTIEAENPKNGENAEQE